jgi:hypothetical protein
MSETYGVQILCEWLSLASDVTGRICLMLLWVLLAPAIKKPRQAMSRRGCLLL